MILQFCIKLYTYITYFLAPPFCLFCSATMITRQALCQNCVLQIRFIVPFDLYCGKDKMIKVFAFCAYKDPIRALILTKHHKNKTAFALLVDYVIEQATIVNHLDFDYIVYIPLHWTRYAARGFNQAELLAHAIARKTGRSVIPLLQRCKKTQFQARLRPDERLSNVHQAFGINKTYEHLIAGKKILIVDDLFTTGATIKSAASVLWPYKPSEIQVFTICRVVQ